jgi:hypothetical protein
MAEGKIHRGVLGGSEGLRRPQSGDDTIELVFVCCSARWLKESGISDREYKYWIVQKPKCHASTEGFRSVRLQDFYPALLVYAYGLLLATAILIAETLHQKLRCCYGRYGEFL